MSANVPLWVQVIVPALERVKMSRMGFLRVHVYVASPNWSKFPQKWTHMDQWYLTTTRTGQNFHNRDFYGVPGTDQGFPRGFSMGPCFRTFTKIGQIYQKWFHISVPLPELVKIVRNMSPMGPRLRTFPGTDQNLHKLVLYGSTFSYLPRNWSKSSQMGSYGSTLLYLHRNRSTFPQWVPNGFLFFYLPRNW